MCVSDENNTNRIIQMPSKVSVSEFDRNQKVVALLLTEMLKVKCKDVNKSKFGLFGLAILLLCLVPSVLICFKPVKPEHYRALQAHILRVLLTKYCEMAQQWNNKMYY